MLDCGVKYSSKDEEEEELDDEMAAVNEVRSLDCLRK